MTSYVFECLQSASVTIFGISAIIGVTLFLLRVFATGFDFVSEAESVSDFELHHEANHLLPSFNLFTLHSISGFLMMFGLSGLACMHQFQCSPGQSAVYAFAVGFAVMLVTAAILHVFLRLQGKGAVFAIERTVGLVGTVYQTIPERGQGKVQLVVNGITRELLAQSKEAVCIDSFSTVKVVRVIDHEIVEVIQLF